MNVLKQFDSIEEMKEWARTHLDIDPRTIDRLASGELTIRVDLAVKTEGDIEDV